MPTQEYSLETITDLVSGLELATKSNLLVKRGNFMSKFLDSLVEIHSLVTANKYDRWNRKQANHFHTWLSYNVDKQSIVLNSRREDDWSNSLIDQAIEAYSPNGIKEWLKFTKSEEYKANLDVVCGYYERTGNYFSRSIQKFRKGEVLGKAEYDKIVGNKYAQKVLVAHQDAPVFLTGSLVDFRASHEETIDERGIKRVYKRAPMGLLILANNAPIVSACKGAKRYKVVPIGNNEPFYVEERWLKKRKKRK